MKKKSNEESSAGGKSFFERILNLRESGGKMDIVKVHIKNADLLRARVKAHTTAIRQLMIDGLISEAEARGIANRIGKYYVDHIELVIEAEPMTPIPPAFENAFKEKL